MVCAFGKSFFVVWTKKDYSTIIEWLLKALGYDSFPIINSHDVLKMSLQNLSVFQYLHL